MIGFQKSEKHDMCTPALAPVDYNKRSITYAGMGIVWFGMAVQITSFASFAPMVNYFTIRELLWIYVIGSALLSVTCLVAQDIGLRYGISFASSIVASFGYRGGKFAGVIRIIPSLIFFGLNGYLGGVAINEAFKILFHFDNLVVSVGINMVALVIVTLRGLKGIEVFSKIAAPLMLAVGGYMLWIVLTSYGVSFGEVLDMGKTAVRDGGNKSWFYGFAVVIGSYSSVTFGMNDFTKDCKVKGDIVGNKWSKSNVPYFVTTLIGVVPFLTMFTIIGSITVALSGSQDVLVVLLDLIRERSVVMALIIQLFIFVAQLSTNTAANLLPSAYVVCSLIPKWTNFKTATIGFAAVAVLSQPWHYVAKLDKVLSLMSSTAGPVLAIVAVDYYVFRKRNIDLNAIFSSKGKYKYWNGFNPAALIAYIAATGIGLLFFDYSYYISIILAVVLYYILAKVFSKKYPVITHEDEVNLKFEEDEGISAVTSYVKIVGGEKFDDKGEHKNENII